VNVNVSEYFWIKLLGKKMPESPWIREIPGFAAVAFYLFVLPPLLMKTVFRKFAEQIGFIRFNVFIMHFLFMAALPIKMVLRWTLNLKYIVAIPEFFFNI
jgi:hypothetical protein